MQLLHQKLLGFLLCFAACQSVGNAAIIVSFIDTTALNSTTASFQVYARASAGTESIGGYGFSLTINNSPGSPSATQVGSAPSNIATSNWSGLANNGPPLFVGSTVTFVGTNNPPATGTTANLSNVNIGIGEIASGPTSTLIGTVSFTRNLLTTYTINSSLSTYTTAGASVSGFVNIASTNDGFGNITNTPSTVASNAATASFTITAVPEPSAMALVGLVLGGFGWKKLRSRGNKAKSL